MDSMLQEAITKNLRLFASLRFFNGLDYFISDKKVPDPLY